MLKRKISIAVLFLLVTLTSCKYPVILRAKLIDDLSVIDLVLYCNNEYKLHSHWALGTTYKKYGKFKIEKDMIIFLDLKTENNFIPDTLYIKGEKIIREFKTDGSPNIDFARYFVIKTNRLKH